MSNIRAQVILHTTDNLAANYITNSWAIRTTDIPGDSDFLTFTTCFKEFYDDISGILGGPIAQNGHEVKYYDLDFTTPPNYPLAENTFNLVAAVNSDGLPSEVALCLSFQGERVPGFPQARRRGRIYLGSLRSNVNSTGRPTSTARTTVANAAATLSSNLKALSNISQLGVWSRADGDFVAAVDGWIDDTFDTQRRRGVQRTSRTTWVVP